MNENLRLLVLLFVNLTRQVLFRSYKRISRKDQRPCKKISDMKKKSTESNYHIRKSQKEVKSHAAQERASIHDSEKVLCVSERSIPQPASRVDLIFYNYPLGFQLREF